MSTIGIITFVSICVLALWLIWEMGNSKRALDEIRSLAGAGTNTGYQKKSWSLCLKLKKIKEFWYQCFWRNPKVAQEPPEKITQEVAQEPPKKITLDDDFFSDYEKMKKSKNVWRCPW